MKPLPKILKREPLMDAVFEVRLGGEPQLSSILPGVLFGQLRPRPTIHRLPAHEIPQPIRAREQNLVFAPTLMLELEQFRILIGDRNVVVSCKLPYPKWDVFKEMILDITKRISKVGITGPVERYSISYVNLIRAEAISEQIKKIQMSIKLGDHRVSTDPMSLQVRRSEDDTLHFMSVITGAQVQTDDEKQVSGVFVNIDSIREVEFPDFVAFFADLSSAVETLRQSNKEKFFSCLTEAAIQEMGPEYV